MLGMTSRTLRFLQREDGPTAFEYAVMLALIVVVCVAVVQGIGLDRSSTFASVSSAVAS